MEGVRARLLVLPGDPELHCIEFDQPFWDLWGVDLIDPHTKRSSTFGNQTAVSAGAAYWYKGYGEEWERYSAITHAGAFEVCLGWDAFFESNDPQHHGADVFCLVTIVGRTALGLAHYGKIRERFDLKGPWELSLALRGTYGSLLGDFGQGWTDVSNPRYPVRKNVDANVLLRREIQHWPDGDGIRQLAYELGDQIENAWGSVDHRYVAIDGDHTGRFDVAKYLSRE
ncbi:MAG: hypothetical protein IH957_13400 [Chloroflexi bacterium]|nr:hypothetical protein [Chloroflexota bacterium]